MKIINYIAPIITLFLIIPHQTLSMYTTFFRPTFWLEKPRFDRRNMTSYELSPYYAWADKSFDKNGEKVPLLAFANPEPLLPSFLEPIKNCAYNSRKNDESPIGYAIFDAKYVTTVITNEIIQNFHENFFVQINIPLGLDTLKNISITPTNKAGVAIEHNEEIDTYLDALSSKLFESKNRNIQYSPFIGPSFILFGFTKSFTHFTRLDLLDFEFKTGLVLPDHSLDKESDFLLLPRTNLNNYGIPFQLKCMIGIYDWLNFGVSATTVLHIKKDSIYKINQQPYPNMLIIPTKKMASMLHYPFLAFTTYIEGENFLPHWTWHVGLNFIKQLKTVFEICGGSAEENRIANQFPSQLPWEQISITLSSEFDIFSQEGRIMPKIRITYANRLFGKNCFDSSLVSGHLGFDVLYDF
ncbi:hypothetical protein HYV10_02305 [Candidatus Dependentiae bacterium]|nr:hypothetical protein [Candidatus Dependentiae bacterium]